MEDLIRVDKAREQGRQILHISSCDFKCVIRLSIIYQPEESIAGELMNLKTRRVRRGEARTRTLSELVDEMRCCY